MPIFHHEEKKLIENATRKEKAGLEAHCEIKMEFYIAPIETSAKLREYQKGV